MYARIWRWHFFAAMIVIPFVLWQSITGTLYVWHEELADAMHSPLRQVTARDTRVPYQQQLDTALARHSGQRLEKIEIPAEPNRATSFYFQTPNGLPSPAFVDPYTGRYLGSVTSTSWMPGVTRALHGGWPINPWGSYLLELGACWAIVMILTGLYLWWPRNARGAAGAFYPRLTAGSRVFWRDVHSVAGVYFSLIVLTFLITALPWTAFWGDKLLSPVQDGLGQNAPRAASFGEHGGHASHTHHASAHAGGHGVTLDQVLAQAWQAGAQGSLEVRLRENGAPIGVRSRAPRAADELHLTFDRHSGALIARADWADFPGMARVISTGVDLHEGTFFGRLNQWFNTVVALGLVWLSVSGFIGWYRRRPHGGLAAPPRMTVRWPRAVQATGGALCVMLPLLGLSVLCILVLDRALGRWLSPLALPESSS